MKIKKKWFRKSLEKEKLEQVKTFRKKIIFYTFPVDKNSGGNSLIAKLVKHINSLFKEPIIYVFIDFDSHDTYTVPIKSNTKRKFDIKKYLNKNYTRMKSYEEENYPIIEPDMIFNQNNIVIYPEINGNPFNFKNVVRFNLYFNINENDKDEYIIYYCKTYKKIENLIRSKNNRPLVNFEELNVYPKYLNYTINLEDILNRCYDFGNVREGSCYIVRKGVPDFEISIRNKIDYHPKDAYLIPWDNFGKIEEIFNKYKYFYCYDIYSFLLPIAALCGCIPIAVPIEGCDNLEDAYQEEWMLKGIAYGDSKEAIEHAINTRDELRKILIKKSKENYDDLLKDLIININKYFIEKVKKETLEHIVLVKSLEDKMLYLVNKEHISEYFYYGYEHKKWFEFINYSALLLNNNLKLNCLVKSNKGFLDLDDNKFYMPFNIMMLNNRDAPIVFFVCNEKKPFLIIQCSVYGNFQFYYDSVKKQFLRGSNPECKSNFYVYQILDYLTNFKKSFLTLNNLKIINKPKKYYYFGFNINVGHHVWNEIPGLISILKIIKPNELDGIIFGPYDYFKLRDRIDFKNLELLNWNGNRHECYLDHIPIITNHMFIPGELKNKLNINPKFKETDNIIINIDLRINRRILKNQITWYSYLISNLSNLFKDKYIEINIFGYFKMMNNNYSNNEEINLQNNIFNNIASNTSNLKNIILSNCIGLDIMYIFENYYQSDLHLWTLGTCVGNLMNWILNKGNMICYGPKDAYKWQHIQYDTLGKYNCKYLPIEYIISVNNDENAEFDLKYKDTLEYIKNFLLKNIKDRLE